MFENGIDFFEEQKNSYRTSNSRMNIWGGPIRAGKTVISIPRWIKDLAFGPPGDMVMVGKTSASLHRNVIRTMEELLGNEMRYHTENDSRVIDIWGRKVFCVGANDERAEQKIRGATFAGAYGDEITLWPESFFKQLMFRLSIRGAKLIGTTNPDNPNHYLKRDYIDRADNLDLKYFSWAIDCNNKLPEEYVANLKKEYTGLWHKRFILGEWCVAEGAVYDFFDDTKHIGKTMPEAKEYYVSIDYGINNPTSIGLYGYNPDTFPKAWRVKGYWWDSKKEGRQKTDEDYSKDLGKFLGDILPKKIYVDPSAASLKVQIKKDHPQYIIQDADNEVLEGIQTQSKMLYSGEYMIADDPSNQPCIDEYYGYLWNEKSAARGIDEPIKSRDHSKDDERYFLHTKFGKKTLDYEILTRL